MLNRLIKSNNAGGGGCTDIVDNYDPFGGNGVALYQLNGDATDVSGNYNGTASNVTYGTGVFGQAGVFNGSNSEITISSTSTSPVNFSDKNYTISAWIKTTQTTTNVYGSLLTKYGSIDDNRSFGVFFRGSDGKVIFLERATGATEETISNASVNDGAWHNIVVVKTSNTKLIYIDGSLDVSKNTTFTPNSGSSEPLRIGSTGGTTNNRINGSIDQVRIFNEALEPLEVEALYTEELCICDGTVDTLDILGDGSCIATYQLDGNANDLSGNYSGTATNVSYGVGEFDLAGVFNGSSSYVLVPDSPALRLTGDYTISFWFKTNSIGAIQRLINKDNANDFSGGWALVLEPDSSITWCHNDGSNNQNWNTGVSITANTWYYVTAIYSDSNNLRSFYLNGNLQNSIATNTNIAAETDVMLFGAYGQSGPLGQYFNGYLDQVRIFNKALNSTEVTTLYNETACTKAACTGTTNTLDILGDGSCIATYPLDGSPADLSGNYNGVQTDVTYPQGYFDLAGVFNGSSSYINGTLNAIKDLSSDNFSLSIWVKMNSAVVSLIYSNMASSNLRNIYILGNADRTIEFRCENGASRSSSTSTTALTLGVWYHIVATYSTTTGSNIYVNSVSEDTNSYVALDRASHSVAAIGAYALSLGSFFEGELDQFRIFNKALSAGEVTTLYNETPCN